ncbi:hypothetical protein CAPTEDRAFT_215788 [Capitella teleta]|uniref:Uncharacterized protein n=1 Tax=Capitella teleta TaxID=283909 RepID=R7THK6_CAPTE|nr:hypothetical protein CAPTEDRAFT_215788 [Capitella teleta]|eukprot:ELT92937.1 hypothetical protein CAPTEDRAFT_215788 [Capitella teleta]
MNDDRAMCELCDHEVRWFLGESGEGAICLACIVVILEEESELVVWKKPALRQLLQLLGTKQESFAQLLVDEARLSMHMCNCLLGLLTASDLCPLINEAVLMIVNCAQSPELVNCLLEVISQQCLVVQNYNKCVGHFSLVGRLASSIPAPFIEFVCGGLQQPESSVSLSAVSVLLPVFREPSSCAILTHLSEFLIGNLSRVLSQLPLNNQNALLGMLGLLIHSICNPLYMALIQGLLRVLLSAGITVTSSDLLAPMISSFKRLLLGAPSVVQSACVQCLMALLGSAHCESILLKVDVAGAESIVVALSNAVDSMSPDTVIQGLQLLSCILLKHRHGRLLPSAVAHQMLCALHSALKNPQRPLFQAATDAFLKMLTLDHLGCPVPFGQLLSMLNSIVSRIPVRQYKQTFDAAKKETKALNDLLTITSKACRFASACKDQPTSDASAFRVHSLVNFEADSLEDFSLGCQSILSLKCLPHLTNTDSTSFDALKNALNSIIDLSKVVPKNKFHEFAEKLADGGFISFCLQVKTKHGEALTQEVSKALTCVIHEIDSSVDADDLQKVIYFINWSSDSISEDIVSDGLLVLLKCAELHSDQVLSSEQLHFMLDAIWQQHASLHLLINSLHLIMMHDLKLSSASLLNLLAAIQQDTSTITEVLLQNPKYLTWVFSEEEIAETCGLPAVMFVLREVDVDVWTGVVQELAPQNNLFVKTCLELITVGSEVSLMLNIERILSPSILNAQTPIPDGVEHLIKSLPLLINSMFLNSDPCFHPGLASLLRLQSQVLQHQDDSNVKILFHVQNVLSRNELDENLEMAALNFIAMTSIHALLRKRTDSQLDIIHKGLNDQLIAACSAMMNTEMPVDIPLSSFADILPGPSSVGPLSLYASLLLSNGSSPKFIEKFTKSHHQCMLLIIQQNLAMMKCVAECETITKRIIEDFSSNEEKYREGSLEAALLEKNATEIMKKEAGRREGLHLKWGEVRMQDLHRTMLLNCLKEISLQLTL